jgi:putative membrane protein
MKILAPSRFIVNLIITLSVAVPLIVILLMNIDTRTNLLGLDVGTYPFFHAVINGLTAILLAVGYTLIKNDKMKLHRNVMMSAFMLSVVFLVSYVISKISHEPVPFGGEGFMRPLYFTILISHIVLSGIIVPLVLFTMYRALTGQYEKHKKIAKWTFPIWVYVSITGVLVYIFMQPYY